MDTLPGSIVIRIAFILANYQSLNKKLALEIFNGEFIGKLDDEIVKEETSRGRYLCKAIPNFSPIRYNMMNLNRSVCINYPEYNIPWFCKLPEEIHHIV